MTDTKRKHGGARPNAGRKPKREEDRLTSLFDSAITDEDLQVAFKAVLRSAKGGNVQALKELLDRRFGKVVDRTELSGEVKLASVKELTDDELANIIATD